MDIDSFPIERPLVAIQQTAIQVPAAIQAAIESGELFRNGSVVRDASGHFVKLLNEVPINQGKAVQVAAAVDHAVKGAFDQVKKNPRAALALGVSAAVVSAAVGTVTFKSKRAKESKIRERALIEDKFNAAGKAWISAASKGELTDDVINELQEAWDAYSASNAEWGAKPNELATGLMELMQSWNAQNGIEAAEPNSIPNVSEREDNQIVDLTSFLDAQRTRLSEGH